MEIQLIIDMILAQATMWGPAIAAILGIVVSIIPAYKKIKDALKSIEATNKEVRKTKELEQLHADLRQAHLDNKQTKDLLNAVLDKMAKVQNYSEKAGITNERTDEENKE